MCLKPLKIRNPTRCIASAGGQQLTLEVPCGQCAECVQTKRNEWYLRTYYQVQHTMSQGGYVYFDTLTYDNSHLPHLSRYLDLKKYPVKDFSCFSHEDFRAFLKRLRRMINYRYGLNDAFKYFLTSEYGVDDRYTHRPHYHILFFVTAKIHPKDFSLMVFKAWKYGRTDGLPYQPVSYVAQHVYGYDMGFSRNDSFDIISSTCMYVSKYITKHSKFRKVLDARIAKLRELGLDDDTLKVLIRQVDMFHRQSQGFGLSYLHTLDERCIALLGEDKVCMQDKKLVLKTFPIPMYYKRHMWYKMLKRDDGTRYWQLTDEGIEHVVQQKLKQVDNTVLKLIDELHNSQPMYRDKFFEFLQGRDISDYVIYTLFYRGRMRNSRELDYDYVVQKHGISDDEYNLYDWLSLLRQQYKCNDIYVDSMSVVDGFVRVANKNFARFPLFKHIPLKVFVDKFTFNESSCWLFRDFDKISDLLNDMRKEKNFNKQTTFEYLEELREKLKNNEAN